jgi:PAS domain-containing protein
MRRERGEPSPWFKVWTIASLAGLLVLIFATFLAIEFDTLEVDRTEKIMAKAFRSVAGIVKASLHLMLLSAFQISDPRHQEIYVNATDNITSVMIGLVNEFVWDEVIADVPPFRNWSKYSTMLVDFTQLLAWQPTSVEDFRYLKARALLLFDISQLVNATLPALVRPYFMTNLVVRSWDWLEIRLLAIVAVFILAFSEVVYSKQKSWFFGARILLSRHMVKVPQAKYYTRDILMGNEPDYLEEIPFAIVIRNSDGVIQFANQYVSLLTNYTVTQIIGQRFDEFFDLGNAGLDFEVIPFGVALELVVIRDISERNMRIHRLRDLLARMRSDFAEIPLGEKLVYIDVRCGGEARPEVVFDAFDGVERQCLEVHRIGCSVSMYKGLTAVAGDAVSFALGVVRALGRARAAVTQGTVTLISLADDDALVVPCGMAVKRAEECVVHGVWGRLYVDEEILAAAGGGDVSDIVMLGISPARGEG